MWATTSSPCEGRCTGEGPQAASYRNGVSTTPPDPSVFCETPSIFRFRTSGSSGVGCGTVILPGPERARLFGDLERELQPQVIPPTARPTSRINTYAPTPPA